MIIKKEPDILPGSEFLPIQVSNLLVIAIVEYDIIFRVIIDTNAYTMVIFMFRVEFCKANQLTVIVAMA